MKRTILLLLLLSTYVSKAQIEIIEKPIIEISAIKVLGVPMESLSKDTVNDFYFITYRDASNPQHGFRERPMKTFKIGDKKSVLKLREIMLNMLANKEKELTIKMEGTILNFKRNNRAFYTLLKYSDGSEGYMTSLTKSYVKKLFPINKI